MSLRKDAPKPSDEGKLDATEEMPITSTTETEATPKTTPAGVPTTITKETDTRRQQPTQSSQPTQKLKLDPEDAELVQQMLDEKRRENAAKEASNQNTREVVREMQKMRAEAHRQREEEEAKQKQKKAKKQSATRSEGKSAAKSDAKAEDKSAAKPDAHADKPASDGKPKSGKGLYCKLSEDERRQANQSYETIEYLLEDHPKDKREQLIAAAKAYAAICHSNGLARVDAEKLLCEIWAVNAFQWKDDAERREEEERSDRFDSLLI